MRPDDSRICFCFSASRGGISLPRWKGWTSPGVGCVGCVGVGDAAGWGGLCCGLPANFQEKAGSLLGGGGSRGSGACCDCSGFPVGKLPRVGGRPWVRGSGLPEDGSWACQSPPGRQEVRGPGPPVPDPRGADISGYSMGCGTWFLPRGPAQAKCCRTGLSVGPRLSQHFSLGFL